MVELTDLRLPHVNGELSVDRLRQFLVLICSCRSNLTLPPKDEPLTWDFVGVMPPAGATLAVGSLHTLLKRMNYVLALPPDRFKKAGAFSLRLEVLDGQKPKNKLAWLTLFLVEGALVILIVFLWWNVDEC